MAHNDVGKLEAGGLHVHPLYWGAVVLVGLVLAVARGWAAGVAEKVNVQVSWGAPPRQDAAGEFAAPIPL